MDRWRPSCMVLEAVTAAAAGAAAVGAMVREPRPEPPLPTL